MQLKSFCKAKILGCRRQQVLLRSSRSERKICREDMDRWKLRMWVQNRDCEEDSSKCYFWRRDWPSLGTLMWVCLEYCESKNTFWKNAVHDLKGKKKRQRKSLSRRNLSWSAKKRLKSFKRISSNTPLSLVMFQTFTLAERKTSGAWHYSITKMAAESSLLLPDTASFKLLVSV